MLPLFLGKVRRMETGYVMNCIIYKISLFLSICPIFCVHNWGAQRAGIKVL